MPVPYAAIAAAAAPTIAGMFGKKKTIEEPKEIQAARNLLLDFARTGKFGGFTAGENVPLGYGDFSPTDIENTGLSSLQHLLQNGIPDQYRMGDDALKGFLDTDPTAVQAQFDPFKRQVEKDTQDQESAAKRSAAFAGNLYSTDTIQNLGDIRSNANDTLTSKLAELTDSALNRRLSAIPLAYQAGEGRQNLALQQIGASQTYGGLARNLNDQSIKARDAEILRRRQELQLPIGAAGTVLNGPSQIPISSSPYQDVLSTLGQVGGQYLGNELFMNQYQRFFPSAKTN